MNPEEPKSRLPHNQTVHDDKETATNIVASGVLKLLEDMRTGPAKASTHRRKVHVAPGRSISAEDILRGEYYKSAVA